MEWRWERRVRQSPRLPGWVGSFRLSRLIIEHGVNLDLRSTSLKTIKAFAERSISAGLAEASSWCSILGGVPDLAPLAR